MRRGAELTGWRVMVGLLALAAVSVVPCRSQAAGDAAVVALPPALRHGRELLQAQHFAEAKTIFSTFLQQHPGAVQAEMGLGDAQLGLRELEAAETTYRGVVAVQPQLWQAHKDLVVVEAALGRWEEFDRERTVLRMARERGAQGISPKESDLIDTFQAGGGHWIVRAYFEPVGRSEAQYNFERFSPEGRIKAYISLEDKAAAQAALTPGDVRIGAAPAKQAAASYAGTLVLNWYTGSAHGVIRTYAGKAPTYEALRAEVRQWIERHPKLTGDSEKIGSKDAAPSPAHRMPEE